MLNNAARACSLLFCLSLVLQHAPGAQAQFTVASKLRNVAVPFGVVPGQHFVPLDCNAQFSPCQSWTSMNLGDVIADTVTVPCGECWTLDIKDGSTLYLDAGIDIVGKLVIDPDANVTIVAPVILVQGEFFYEMPRAMVTPQNVGLTIRMTGTDILTFLPQAQNAAVCGTNTSIVVGQCEIGKKPIVVAGGKFILKSWPDRTCPTWTRLYDTVSDPTIVPQLTPPEVPPAGCSYAVINETFPETPLIAKNIPPDNWYPTPGSRVAYSNVGGASNSTGYYIKSYRRQKEFMGVYYQIPQETLNCLSVNNTKYLFSARVRLTSTTSNSSLCSQGKADGKYCIQVTMQSMDATGDTKFLLMYHQTADEGAYHQDGTWFWISEVFDLNPNVAAVDGAYNTILFSGPEGGIDISIDDVLLTRVTPDYYPDPEKICSNMAYLNGDAEKSALFAYPVETTNIKGSLMTIREETTANGTVNKYFHLTGRAKDYSSPMILLEPQCIAMYGMYRFEAKIRVLNGNEYTKPRMVVKVWSHDPNAVPPFEVRPVAFCKNQTESDGWVHCAAMTEFTEKEHDAAKLEFYIIAGTNQTIPGTNLTWDVDYDDLKVSLYKGPATGLVLHESVKNCWGPGSEIAVSSNTFNYSDSARNVITNVTTDGAPQGQAIVYLKTPMRSHTTLVSHPWYASEVVLLSRNTKFLSDMDDGANPQHGGHFIIFHTPNQTQILEGVEIKGYGQLGNLGRYPVHAHMCDDSPDMSISFNSVRDSFQRCYNIHNTHNATVQQNVAHNTIGHCFLFEDGSEQDNKWLYNLAMDTLNTPKDKLVTIIESDFQASSFWSATVENWMEGNVAAGSQDSGMWIEMLENVRGPSEQFYPGKNPSRAALKRFWKNVIHSCGREGLRLYPNGHYPDDGATYEDTWSFRNKGDGVLLFNSRWITIKGGVFSDNRMQVEQDKHADRIHIEDIFMEGYSDSFRYQVEARPDVHSHCPVFRPLIGIQLHSYLRYRDSEGHRVHNITFQNFGETLTGCTGSVSINVDQEIDTGHHDAYTTFSNLTFQEGTPMSEKFEICTVTNHYVGNKAFEASKIARQSNYFRNDVMFQDMTGDLDPQNLHRPGFVVSNNISMTKFCPEAEMMEGSCAKFCPGKCFRAVSFGFSPDEYFNDMVLRATDTATGEYTDFISYYTNQSAFTTIGNKTGQCCIADVVANTVEFRRRYVTAHLPYGDYNLTFAVRGTPVWPIFQEMQWGRPFNCSPYIDDTTIHIVPPPLPPGWCDDLATNGDGSEGRHYWVHTGGGIQEWTGGVGGANDPCVGSSGLRKDNFAGPAQFLDTRCLSEGLEYEVTANFKLMGKDANNNSFAVACNPNEKASMAYYSCPRLSIEMRTMLGHNIGDEIQTLYMFPVATAVAPATAGWNTMVGTLTILPEVANATTVMIYSERARLGVDILFDNLKILPRARTCDNLIWNGDFASGDTRYFTNYGAGQINIVNLKNPDGSNNYAIWSYNRQQYFASAAQEFKVSCLNFNDTFKVTAKVALVSADTGAPVTCLPATKSYNDSTHCPEMVITAIKGNVTQTYSAGGLIGSWKTGLLNDLYGEFTVDEFMDTAELVQISVSGIATSVDIIMDDLSIVPGTQWTCDMGLVRNAGAEDGDTKSWSPWLGGTIDAVNATKGIIAKDGNFSFVSDGRLLSAAGIQQVLNPACFSLSGVYSVSAWVKLVSNNTDFACDPASTALSNRCPLIEIAATNTGGGATLHPVGGFIGSSWNTGWNEITGTFQFFDLDLAAGTTSLVIAEAATGVKMYVDKIDIKRML